MGWSQRIANQEKNFKSFFTDIFQNTRIFPEIIKKDIKTSFAQSLLGPSYLFLLPFVQAFVFNFLLNNVAKADFSGNVPSYLFYLSGFMFWNLFANGANRGSSGIINNIKLIQQISIPRIVFVISPIIYSLIIFAASFLIFIIFNFLFFLEINFTIELSTKFLIIIPLILYCMLLSLTYSIFVSSISIKYRDFIYANSVVIQILMILSCVLFTAENLTGIPSYMLYINPFILVTETFRWIWFDSTFTLSLGEISSQIIIFLISFFVAVKLFLKKDKFMVDLI